MWKNEFKKLNLQITFYTIIINNKLGNNLHQKKEIYNKQKRVGPIKELYIMK